MNEEAILKNEAQPSEGMADKSRKGRKYQFTTKTWLYFGGLGGLLSFIIVSAVWDLVFGSFDLVKFVADTLILVAIAMGTLVLMNLFSVEVNQNKLKGLYQTRMREFLVAMEAIESIRIYFSQWYYWFLQREIKSKRETWLLLNGIQGEDAKAIVEYASLDDIDRMRSTKEEGIVKTMMNGKKVVLPRIQTDQQAAVVRDVLLGKHDIIDKGYADYLYVDDVEEAALSIIERKDYLKKRREAARRRSKAMVIIRLVMTSLLMAALVPADPEEANANKWWILFKRVGVFCTSLISGWFQGSNDVVALSAIVDDKTNMLKHFKKSYDAKEWRPKTKEEMDAEIIARYEKEQKEAVEAVVEQNYPLLQGGM